MMNTGPATGFSSTAQVEALLGERKEVGAPTHEPDLSTSFFSQGSPENEISDPNPAGFLGMSPISSAGDTPSLPDRTEAKGNLYAPPPAAPVRS